MVPAPDLPPPPSFDRPTSKVLAVHLHADDVTPQELAGGVVVVIDAIRASVSIAQALASGAACVIPTLSADEARARAAELRRENPAAKVVLGGERGGVLIEGFDLDNSPFSYTPGAVRGATVVFTTTNGTSGLLHAKLGARVLVGSMCNISAICDAVAHDERPVHILCCGTRHELSMDDCLPAGAMVERLLRAGRNPVADDAGRLCLAAWRWAFSSQRTEELMRDSRGGRNMVRIGLSRDVTLCSTPDAIPVVPEFFVASGRITLAR